MSINAKIDDKEVRRALDRIMNNAKSLPMERVGNILEESVRTNFDVGGRYSSEYSKLGGNQNWTPPKDGGRPLYDTGRLKRSIDHRVTQNGVEINIGDPLAAQYASAHNYGYRPRNLPARPFMVYQDQDVDDIYSLFAKHLIKGLKKA